MLIPRGNSWRSGHVETWAASKKTAINLRSWISERPPYDREVMESRNEIRWRNNLAFVRKHLVTSGFISDRVWGEWRITEKGTVYFHELCRKAEGTGSFQHASREALLKVKHLISSPTLLSDDSALTGETEFQEGGRKYQWVTRYERDAQIRAKAIEIHGTTCMGYCFDFEKTYGLIGRGFIEVHHIKPVSSFGGVVAVNPQSDMITLCSNCHSIAHRKKSAPLTLNDLKALLEGRHADLQI